MRAGFSVKAKQMRSIGTQKNAIHEHFSLHLVASWRGLLTPIEYKLIYFVRTYMSSHFFVAVQYQTYWMFRCVRMTVCV